MPFGKFKGILLADLPDGYLEWLVGLGDLREPLSSAVADEYRDQFGEDTAVPAGRARYWRRDRVGRLSRLGGAPPPRPRRPDGRDAGRQRRGCVAAATVAESQRVTVLDVARDYCSPSSIAARIAGTMSGQDRCATASNRCATARVQVTETASGLNTGLPKRRAGLSAADSSEPTGTAAFRRSNWGSVKTISIIGTGVGRWEL